MNKKEKNTNIVALRFIAILLVVFGHSIILYDPTWGQFTSSNKIEFLSILKHIINVIQMPLFFSISGYLFFNTLQYNLSKYNIVFKKFRRLIIPFLFIGTFYFLPLKYVFKIESFTSNSFLYNFYHNLLLGYGNGHLWYIVTLFIIFTLFTFTYSNKEHYYIDIFYFLIFVFCNLISYKYVSYLYNTLTYFIYFYIGFMVNKYKMNKNKSFFNLILAIITIIITNKVPSSDVHLNILKIFLLMTSLMLIYSVNFSKLSKSKVVNLISEDSFGLYLFHSPLIYISFVYFPNINPLLLISFNFIFLGFVALLITEVLKRTKLKFIIGL